MTTTILLAMLCIGFTEVLSGVAKRRAFGGNIRKHIAGFPNNLHEMVDGTSANEIAEHAKKMLGDLHDKSRDKITEHIGDIVRDKIMPDNFHEHNHKDVDEGDGQTLKEKILGMIAKMPPGDNTEEGGEPNLRHEILRIIQEMSPDKMKEDDEQNLREMIFGLIQEKGPGNSMQEGDGKHFRDKILEMIASSTSGDYTEETESREQHERPSIFGDVDEKHNERRENIGAFVDHREPETTDDNEEDKVRKENKERRIFKKPKPGRENTRVDITEAEVTDETDAEHDNGETNTGGMRERIRQRFRGNRRRGKAKKGGKHPDAITETEEENAEETNIGGLGKQKRRRFRAGKQGKRANLRRRPNGRD